MKAKRKPKLIPERSILGFRVWRCADDQGISSGQYLDPANAVSQYQHLLRAKRFEKAREHSLISRDLALLIGWDHSQMRITDDCHLLLWCPEIVNGITIPEWRRFDYRNTGLMRTILQRWKS